MGCIGKKTKKIGTEKKYEPIPLPIAVHQALSPAREEHTLRVVEVAERLAGLYGADHNKAVIAAFCHDFTKEWPDWKNENYIKKHGLPTRCLDYPEIAHGHVAAHVLREEYEISDEDILNAIRYHSTGREKMSLLEKIIYLSDLIEEGRTFKGIEEIRAMADRDLDEALRLALREVIAFVKAKGKEPDVLSVQALAYLTEPRHNKNKTAQDIFRSIWRKISK